MSQRMPNLCEICQERDSVVYDAPQTCRAFPNGIPASILSGAEDHFETKFDDRGILFNQIPGRDSALAAYLLFWYNFAEEESQ